LLRDDPVWAERAQKLAARTHELLSFLVNVRGFKSVQAECSARALYHDSCSSMREMAVRREPRLLLESVNGLNLEDFSDADVCCGFGGFFSVKYPEISARLADDKIDDAKARDAELVLSGDLGCLLHLAGRAARRGESLQFRHAAEVLAGATEPPIGED
jgi:L-lactate dehydrogenase complex protein LldE